MRIYLEVESKTDYIHTCKWEIEEQIEECKF